MRNRLEKMLLMLLLAVLAFSSAAGELVDEGTETVIDETLVVSEKDGYHFNAKGFLIGENPGDTYLLEDEENGIWEYSDAHLSVRIRRYTDPVEKTKKSKAATRLYCVAEVYASEESPLFSIMTEAAGKRPGGYSRLDPEKLVAKYPAVFAVSDDYYGYRQYTRDVKGSSWPTGIVIRNGEILYEKTRNSAKKRPFPPLDTLAVYGNGRMKSFTSDEYTAQEYIEQGAVQVFSFGPWLIRNGEINETEAGEKAVYLKNTEPRCVIGMVQPYHYILIVVGIPNGKYKGANGEWLVNKLLEYGCTEGFNLDGGGTACMVFNGKILIHGRWDDEHRSLGSMIAFGKLDAFH